MSSTIFYRFQSEKDSSRVLFDGTGLTVFDLKREIIQINKLGDGSDFQLRLFNPDTQEEYEDDQFVIPRSSSVIARRSPSIKSKLNNSNNLGNATRYVTGKPRVFQSRKAPSTSIQQPNSTAAGIEGITEEERIANMFANQENQWEQLQEEMSTATPVFNKPQQAHNQANANDDGPPPPGYMCYRCGGRDHWIKNCPTNNDPNFEGKRIRRTTGIPKKFLKNVEIDPGMSAEEMAQRKIMITDEGKFVVQIADKQSWEDYQRKQQNRVINKWSPDFYKDLPTELKCPLTKGLIENPVKTTKCCNKDFSKKAIEDALVENDFVCPECGTKDILLDSLVPDESLQEKIDKFIKENNKEEHDDNQHIDKKIKISGTNASGTTLPTLPFMPIPMFPLPSYPKQ